MRYKYLHKIGRLKVEIVNILVIITAVTQSHRIMATAENHGTGRKSR